MSFLISRNKPVKTLLIAKTFPIRIRFHRWFKCLWVWYWIIFAPFSRLQNRTSRVLPEYTDVIMQLWFNISCLLSLNSKWNNGLEISSYSEERMPLKKIAFLDSHFLMRILLEFSDILLIVHFCSCFSRLFPFKNSHLFLYSRFRQDFIWTI